MKKTIYYSDEIKEDFSGIKRKAIPIDDTYPYQHGTLWSFIAYLLYSWIMKPIAFLYMKLRFHFKIQNRKVLKSAKKQGFFLYANHTNISGDGFMPSLICFPKRVYVIVSSENVSLWGTRNFMAMVGAIPIPTVYSGMRGFKEYIHQIIQKKQVVMIYPEAHIRPYYTKIRPYSAVSFTYPVVERKPVFTFTVTYQKGKIRTHITAYVDGPFFPNSSLSKKEAAEELRGLAYAAMVKRSTNSTYEKVTYIRKEEKVL